MSVEVASAYITLTPSMKGFKGKLDKELKGVDTRSAKKAGKKQGGAMGAGMAGAAGGALRKAIGPLAAAAGAVGVGAFFKGAVDSASERQQARGAAEAIWGPLQKDLDEQAKKAAQTVGLTETQYLTGANLIATQLKNRGFEGQELLDMTEELMVRSADMAAMFGGTTEEANAAINAVLRGEYEQIEKYGVSLKQADINAEMVKRGLDGLTGEQKKYAEAQVATDLVLQQTAVSAGTFAEESDTLAGAQARTRAQFDNLKATIGEAFLPVLTTAFTYVNDSVLPAITGFVTGMQDGTGAGGAFAEGIGWLKDKAVDTFTWVRDNVFPIIAEFIQGFKDGEGAGGNLRTTLDSLWEGWQIVAGIVRDTVIPIMMDAWGVFTEYVLPVLMDVWDFIVNTLWPDLVSAFRTHIIPAFNAVADVISTAWDEVIYPALSALWKFIRDTLWPFIEDFYENGIKPTFKLIGSAIEGAWENVIEPVLNFLIDTAADVVDAFSDAKQGIERAWDGIKKAVATPIVAVINFVNDGIIGTLNKVLDWVGIPAIPLVPMPKYLEAAAKGYGANSYSGSAGRAGTGTLRGAFAAGGVLPGYSPGFDNLMFYGQNGSTLALSGGEAIMRPEWTKAVGPNFVNQMNAAARSGGVNGVREAMGFADGGIFAGVRNWVGERWQDVKGFASNLAAFLSSPKDWLKAHFGGITGPFSGAISGFIGKILTGAKDKLMSFVGGDGSTNGSVNYGGKFGWHPTGLPWDIIWQRIKAAAPEAVMTSNYRPGAITNSGITSLHSLGRAVDVVSGNMSATFDKIRPLMKWSQLFYTPKGNAQIGYRDSIVARDHWDHIHAALAKGGILPNLYDNGGWLQPGVSLVSNKTGKPEAVFTDEQLQQFGGDTNITLYGIPMDAAGETADEILYQMRRVRHGKYAHKR